MKSNVCLLSLIFLKKWIVYGTYNPNKSLISTHLMNLSKSIMFAPLYDIVILTGDFNSEISEGNMKDFCDSYNLRCLIKEATCYKNLKNPLCIDLILTNNNRSFQDTRTKESGLPDFHKLTFKNWVQRGTSKCHIL